MKPELLLIVLVNTLLFSACKKGGSSKNNWRIPMIKTETANGHTYTYSYDREGRMVKTEDGTMRLEASYSPDSIFFKTTEIATGWVEKKAGKLNGAGRILSAGDTEYKYDANDRLIEKFSPGSDGWVKRNRYFYNITTGLLDSMREIETRLVETRCCYPFLNLCNGCQYLSLKISYSMPGFFE